MHVVIKLIVGNNVQNRNQNSAYYIKLITCDCIPLSCTHDRAYYLECSGSDCLASPIPAVCSGGEPLDSVCSCSCNDGFERVQFGTGGSTTLQCKSKST